MTTTVVMSGDTVSHVTLGSGDVLDVRSGGAANNTTVNAGATESVDGSATGTTVNYGGTEALYNNGVATGTVVNAGGTQVVYSAASADGTVVNAGSIGTIETGGTASGATIDGGSLTVLSGGTAVSTTIAQAGALFLQEGASTPGGILFSGGNATLDIDGTTMPSTLISGFALTDQVDLGDLAYASSDKVSVSGNTVTVFGPHGDSVSLNIAGAQNDLFSLTAEPDGDGGAALMIMDKTGNPVVSSPTITVAENAVASPIGIAAPTDPNYGAAQLSITAGALPSDGLVTLADGATAITAGEALTVAQLTGLLFTPTHGQFATSSAFTYSVTDPSGNVSNGAATLGIGAAVGNPAVSSPALTVAENASATAIGIVPPTDPNYDTAQLTITVGTLPADGAVTLADGATAVTAGQGLTSAQLTGLLFKPTTGQFSTNSAFSYTVTDPSGNASTGAATLAIGPAAPALTTGNEIVNNASTVITGTAEAGGAVTLFSRGTVIGSAVADATIGVFAVTPSTPLALGLNTLSATVTTASGTSATSAVISLFDAQAPTDGVSTTDFSSADLGAVLSQGAKFAFIGGTEAVLLTDSTLSVGPDTNEATIQRLYEGLLGRGNDTGGMSGWDAQLTAGLSKAALATAFLNSAEYTASHGTQSDSQLVTSLYRDVLGRAPDPAGQADWLGFLAQGGSRGDVAIGFVDSVEAKAHFAPATAQVYAPNAMGTLLHELFETGLGREIELPGLANLKAAFASLTPAQVAADIAGSQEFMNDHAAQGNAAYVSSLYQHGLGRAPDAAGAAGWTSYLDSGGSRSDVMLDFATSQEGVAHLTHNLGA